MLRCKSFSTPLKVADAVPMVDMLTTWTVHEDDTIHVVSKGTTKTASYLRNGSVGFSLDR